MLCCGLFCYVCFICLFWFVCCWLVLVLVFDVIYCCSLFKVVWMIRWLLACVKLWLVWCVWMLPAFVIVICFRLICLCWFGLVGSFVDLWFGCYFVNSVGGIKLFARYSLWFNMLAIVCYFVICVCSCRWVWLTCLI